MSNKPTRAELAKSLHVAEQQNLSLRLLNGGQEKDLEKAHKTMERGFRKNHKTIAGLEKVLEEKELKLQRTEALVENLERGLKLVEDKKENAFRITAEYNKEIRDLKEKFEDAQGYIKDYEAAIKRLEAEVEQTEVSRQKIHEKLLRTQHNFRKSAALNDIMREEHASLRLSFADRLSITSDYRMLKLDEEPLPLLDVPF